MVKYYQYGCVLDYAQNHAEILTVEEYEARGIDAILNDLEENYPWIQELTSKADQRLLVGVFAALGQPMSLVLNDAALEAREWPW